MSMFNLVPGFVTQWTNTDKANMVWNSRKYTLPDSMVAWHINGTQKVAIVAFDARTTHEDILQVNNWLCRGYRYLARAWVREIDTTRWGHNRLYKSHLSEPYMYVYTPVSTVINLTSAQWLWLQYSSN